MVSPFGWSPNGNNAAMHGRRCRYGVMAIESSVLFRNVRSESSDSPVQITFIVDISNKEIKIKYRE